MERRVYATDLSDGEWAIVEPYVPCKVKKLHLCVSS
jgi:hypothetical protein